MVIGAFCLTAIGTVRQVASRRELWNQFIERQADFRVIFPWGEYLGTAVFVALACWGIERIAKSRNPPDVDALENATLGARISWAPLIATLVWLILPLSVAFGLTRLDIARLFYRRYAMFSYPALILLTAGVGVILSSRRSKAIYAVLLVLVTCCLIGPQRQFAGDGRFVRHSHEDWRGVTRAVRFSPSLSSHNIDNDSGKQPPPVLVRTGLIEEELSQTPDEIAAASDYLLFPVSSIYPIPNHDVYLLTSDLQMANNAIEHLSKVSRCTLIIRGKKWFESNRDGILKSLAPRLKPRNSTSGPLQLQVVYDGGNVVLAELGPPTTDR